jgi:hypothetical protein
MKSFVKTIFVAGAVVAFCVTMIVNAARHNRTAQPPPQESKRREKLSRLQIKDFRGDAAPLRAKQLRTLNKGIARAMKDAERRNLKPAFEHGRVILGTDPQDDRPPIVARSAITEVAHAFRPASYRFNYPQDTFTDGQYEVTFIPYDDGDPNTWEGIIYRFDPDWGEDIRFAVLDIQTDEPQVTTETYYPPDGGDSMDIDPLGPPISGIPEKGRSRASARQNRSVSYSSARVTCPSGWKPCLRLRDECCSPPPNLMPWFKCSAKACMVVAGACSRTGPVFSECWGFGCTGAMLMCLI